MTDGTGTTNYLYKVTGELEKVVFPDSKHIQYQYDENGNRLSMTSPFGNTTHYKYNNVNQLVSVGLSPTEQEVNYSYMKNGQLSEKKQANGVTSKYSYNGYNLDTLQHQALDGTILNTYSYKYDGNGNRQTLASDQLPNVEASDYTYDERNRLAKVVTQDGTVVTYKYNGEGLLTERTENGVTTRYYYDGSNIIGEGIVNADGTVTKKAEYLRGIGLIAREDSTGSKAYYTHNGHGDVVELRDSQGQLLNQYSYDIWGNPITVNETVQNPFRYSGELWDETTDLQYLRARWYDPSMGRFINEDTYEGEMGNPLSLNLYTYVHNNPLIYIDPTGHWNTNVTANWTINEMKWQWQKAAEAGDEKKMKHWANEAAKLREDMKEAGISEDDIMQSSDYMIPKHIVSEIATISTLDWIESDILGLKLYVDAALILVPDPTSPTGVLKSPKVNLLKDIKYTKKVQNDMKKGDFHAFPLEVDNFGSLAKVYQKAGGDQIVRTWVEIPGSYKGRQGIFQYIIEPDGVTVNHRVFIPNK
jgi:RHS repeat-associated protein